MLSCDSGILRTQAFRGSNFSQAKTGCLMPVLDALDARFLERKLVALPLWEKRRSGSKLDCFRVDVMAHELEWRLAGSGDRRESHCQL